MASRLKLRRGDTSVAAHPSVLQEFLPNSKPAAVASEIDSNLVRIFPANNQSKSTDSETNQGKSVVEHL